jgi:hypothetical protein
LNQTEAGYEAAKKELVKEFGDPYVLARAYLKRIEAWKNIPSNDTSALKSFSIFLKNCRGSMPSLKHLQLLNTDVYLQKTVGKLATPLQVSWRKAVTGHFLLPVLVCGTRYLMTSSTVSRSQPSAGCLKPIFLNNPIQTLFFSLFAFFCSFL